jgi:hypothetical protein
MITPEPNLAIRWAFHHANLAKIRSNRNRKTDALMSARENLRHPWLITALSIAKRAVAMSPAPAVREPHANRLSVSHPVDMHAHAIIPAPMTNTKSEPIANLRIQGIVSSNLRHGTRSGLAALAT